MSDPEATQQAASLAVEARPVSGDIGCPPAFSPRPELVACAFGNRAELMSANTGELVARLEGHSQPISCMAFGKGTRYLFTGSSDGLVMTYEYAKKMKRVHTHQLGHDVVTLATTSTSTSILYVCVGAKVAQRLTSGTTSEVRGPVSCDEYPALVLIRPPVQVSQDEDDVDDVDADDGGADGAEGDGHGAGVDGEASGAETEEVVSYRVVEYDLHRKKSVKLLRFRRRPLFLDVTADGAFVVCASSRRLVVWSTASREVQSELKFSHATSREPSVLRAVALNPVKPEVATGDVNGRVYLWHTLFEKHGTADVAVEKSGVVDTMPSARKRGMRRLRAGLSKTELRHWHAYGVTCMMFGPDGNYLYTGGEEGVLVMTQLAKAGQNMRFLPRLGARLTGLSVSPDGLTVVVTTRGNSLRLVNTLDLRVRWEQKGLAAPPVDSETHNVARIWPHPRHPSVVISNCLPGTLQMYDVEAGVMTAEVEVVSSNLVARVEGDHNARNKTEGVRPPWVKLMAVSHDGSRFVTLEVRVGEHALRRVALKFWEWDAERRKAVLSSVVSDPHSGKVVTDVAYHPAADLVVTSDAGGTFAMWALVPEGEEVDEHAAVSYRWICQANVPFRCGPIRSVAFSADGSLMAIGAEGLVTLWEPMAARLVATLDRSMGPVDGVTRVCFVPYTTDLLVATRTCVCLWNLVTLSVRQRYEAKVAGVCVAGARRACKVRGRAVHFAIAVHSGDEEEQSLSVFSVHHSEPLATHTIPHRMAVVGMCMTTAGLCYLTRQGLTCFGPPPPTKIPLPRNRSSADIKRGPTLLIEEQPGAKRQRAGAVVPPPVRPQMSVTEMLDAPTTHLPQPSALYNSFLAGLFPPTLEPVVPGEDDAVQPMRQAGGANGNSNGGEGLENGVVGRGGSAEVSSSVAVAAIGVPMVGVRPELLETFSRGFTSGLWAKALE